jgi:hypothetical protein
VPREAVARACVENEQLGIEEAQGDGKSARERVRCINRESRRSLGFFELIGVN